MPINREKSIKPFLTYPFDREIIECLSVKKIRNLLRIMGSYVRHVFFNDYKVHGLPPVLSIEPTNVCNLKCLQCPAGRGMLKRERGEMDVSMFQRIIDSVEEHLIYLMLYFQGEPFLHRNILSMIEYARERNICVVLNTNGHFIKTVEFGKKIVQSSLNRIIVSVDGATEESYKEYRSGGDFNAVISGIRNLAEAKKTLKSKSPKISIQFIVMKHNEAEIEDIKKTAVSIGADDVLFKSVQVYDDEGYDNLLPALERFRRYKKENGRAVLKKPFKNRCLRVLTAPVITWNGSIVPCCFDKDAEYSFGTLSDGGSFEEIWTSGKADDFRKMVFTQRKTINICRNCIE